jgi:hypothetical protein
MKLRKAILIGLAAILLLQAKSFCQTNQTTSANLHPTPPGFASRLDYLKSLTNEAIISTAYKEGLISDDEAMEATSIRVSSLPYTNMADVHKAYDQGLIGKGEAMMLR